MATHLVQLASPIIKNRKKFNCDDNVNVNFIVFYYLFSAILRVLKACDCEIKSIYYWLWNNKDP